MVRPHPKLPTDGRRPGRHDRGRRRLRRALRHSWGPRDERCKASRTAPGQCRALRSGVAADEDRMSLRAAAARPSMRCRGLPGLARPSLKQGGRAVEEYSETYVAFDTSKLGNAV